MRKTYSFFQSVTGAEKKSERTVKRKRNENEADDDVDDTPKSISRITLGEKSEEVPKEGEIIGRSKSQEETNEDNETQNNFQSKIAGEDFVEESFQEKSKALSDEITPNTVSSKTVIQDTFDKTDVESNNDTHDTHNKYSTQNMMRQLYTQPEYAGIAGLYDVLNNGSVIGPNKDKTPETVKVPL